MKGLELCRGFFFEAAKPILEACAPGLRCAAGLIGYGSDVLGYDDRISQDHMWGPRFYLFLSPEDMCRGEEIFQALAENLPCTYRGYSVNFTEPDPLDHGVQHPQRIEKGPVRPLVFIQTVDQFLTEQLGTAELSCLSPLDWLTFSEHRLLSTAGGTLFIDELGMRERIRPLRFYPEEVKLYLLASNWDIIASEQAFFKRCGQCGDEIGAILVCARMAERLMRLCFLYKETYAPYSKWLGTAFQRLDIDPRIRARIAAALQSRTLEERERALVEAQALVAELHNTSGITEPVEYKIEPYYGRDILVIYAERFAEAISEKLKGSALEGVPLMGTLSQIGGLSVVSDDHRYRPRVRKLYQPLESEKSFAK